MRPDRCAVAEKVWYLLQVPLAKIPFINSWNLISTSCSALVVLAFFGLGIINDHLAGPYSWSEMGGYVRGMDGTEQVDHERERGAFESLTCLKVDQRRGCEFTETRGVDQDEEGS